MEDTTCLGLQGGLSMATHFKNGRKDAKELELSVHSMSASLAGHATRSKSAVNSVRRLARHNARASEQGATGGHTAHADEWDVISLLRRACLRMEVDNGRA
jgi:hypothetical protein